MTMILPTFNKENNLRFERAMRTVSREVIASMDNVATFLTYHQAAMQARLVIEGFTEEEAESLLFTITSSYTACEQLVKAGKLKSQDE